VSYTRALFYVSSGTGNSLQCARWIAESLSGTESAIVPVEATTGHNHSGNAPDLLGLVFPAHGFTAPWSMLTCVASLPKADNCDAIVVSTRGSVKLGPLVVPGAYCSAVFIVALLAMIRGYRMRGLLGVDMPSNWMSLHSGQRMETRRLISRRSESRTKRFAAVIAKGNTWLFTLDNLREFISGIVLFPVSLAYLLVGRFYLSKLFFANNNCNGCGVCARHCPQNAIIMKGTKRPRPYWTFDCESCMRCMGYCPQQAIEAGHSWGVLLYMITAVPVSMYLFQYASEYVPMIAAADSSWTRMLLDIAWIYPSLYVSYLVFDILMRIPVINTLFTYTTLTRWYRRYHHPDVSLKEITKDTKTPVDGD